MPTSYESEFGPYMSFGAYFGNELRELRASRGWTAQEFIDEVTGWSLDTVRSIESARRKPPIGFGERTDQVYGLPGTMTRMALAARLGPVWLRHYADHEAAATKIGIWETRLIHGLFQHEDYARAALRAMRPIGRTEEQTDRFVADRMERQQILCRPDPPEVSCVLHEAAIRQVVGDARVMRSQLAKLIELARRPHILLQVLPFAAAEPAGGGGPFVTLEFGDGQPPLAFAEAMGGGRLIDQTDELAVVRRLYDRIRAAALSTEASIGLITGVMGSL